MQAQLSAKRQPCPDLGHHMSAHLPHVLGQLHLQQHQVAPSVLMPHYWHAQAMPRGPAQHSSSQADALGQLM